MEAQHDAVAKTLRAQGLFNEPVFGGLLSVMYLIPKIGICIFQTHAVLLFPIQHVKDDPQEERTRSAFQEQQKVVMGAIGDNGTAFRCSSDSTRAEPDLGMFVRHKKAWT